MRETTHRVPPKSHRTFTEQCHPGVGWRGTSNSPLLCQKALASRTGNENSCNSCMGDALTRGEAAIFLRGVVREAHPPWYNGGPIEGVPLLNNQYLIVLCDVLEGFQGLTLL